MRKARTRTGSAERSSSHKRSSWLDRCRYRFEECGFPFESVFDLYLAPCEVDKAKHESRFFSDGVNTRCETCMKERIFGISELRLPDVMLILTTLHPGVTFRAATPMDEITRLIAYSVAQHFGSLTPAMQERYAALLDKAMFKDNKRKEVRKIMAPTKTAKKPVSKKTAGKKPIGKKPVSTKVSAPAVTAPKARVGVQIADEVSAALAKCTSASEMVAYANKVKGINAEAVARMKKDLASGKLKDGLHNGLVRMRVGNMARAALRKASK